MCGRYTLFSDLTTIDTLIGSSLPNEIDGIFGKQHLQNTAHTLPSYNIAPSHIVPVILQPDTDTPQLIRIPMHWGFMGWKPKVGSLPLLPINTRSEQITEKPMWRSVSTQRCLIPLNGFFEWSGTKGNKTPHYIQAVNNSILFAAGFYSPLSPLDSLYSFSILTTRPNATMQNIHDRMPVFLHSSEWTHWLNPQLGIKDLNYLLDPYPDDGLKSHIVPPAVGNVRNNGPHLIEPELRLF